MAKWFGKVGYSTTVEIEPGIWETDQIVEREYCGDILRNISRRYQNSGGINDDITTSNDISVIADPFAYEKFADICYVEFMGAKWKVSNIEVQYPRIILSLGGVYNG